MVVVSAIVVGLGIAAYLAYETRARGELTARNFRSLATAAQQIRFHVEGIVEALDNVIGGCRARELPSAECGRKIADEIPGARPISGGPRFDRLRARAAGVECGKLGLFVDSRGDDLGLLFFVAPPGAGSDCAASQGGLWIDFDLTPILASIAAQQPFETLLLVDSQGGVLYGSNPVQVPAVDVGDLLDRLVAAGNGEPPPAPAAAGGVAAAGNGRRMGEGVAYSWSALGAQYSAFAKKLHFRPTERMPSALDFADGKELGELSIVGLVPSADFIDEATLIPPLYTGLLLMLLLLLLLLAPAIRFLVVGSAERVSRRWVVAMTFGAFAATGLATFFVCHGIAQRQLRADLDAAADELGTLVAARLCDELGAARSLLGAFEKASVPANGSGAGPIAVDLPLAAAGIRYPFAISEFRSTGDIARRWRGIPPAPDETLRIESTPPASAATYADRKYFLDAMAGNLVACKGAGSKADGFAVDVVRSRRSGRTTVLVAKPSAAADRAVLGVSLPVLSAAPTTMPPGFTFAVIDRAGDVLFHSEPSRARVENLFAEIEAEELEAAIRFGATGRTVRASYRGAPVVLHVRPVAGLDDWSTVVIEEQSDLRTIRGILLANWVALFGLYASVLWGTLVVLHLGRRRRSWIAPRSDRGTQYTRALLLVLLAAVTGLVTVSRYGGTTTAVGVFVVPALVLAILALNLRWEPGRARFLRGALGLAALLAGALVWLVGWVLEDGYALLPPLVLLGILGSGALLRRWVERRPDGYVGPYLALVSVSLVLLAAVPAAAIYRVAYGEAVQLGVRYGQIEGLRRLVEQAEQIVRGLEGDWDARVADDLREVIAKHSARFAAGGNGARPPESWLFQAVPSYYVERSAASLAQCCCCRRQKGDCDEPCSKVSRAPCVEPVGRAGVPARDFLGEGLADSLDSISRLFARGSTEALRLVSGVSLRSATNFEVAIASASGNGDSRWAAAAWGNRLGLCLVGDHDNKLLARSPERAFGVAATFPATRPSVGVLAVVCALMVSVAWLAVFVVARRLYLLRPIDWAGEPSATLDDETKGTVFLLWKPSATAPESRAAAVIDVRLPDAGDDGAWAAASRVADEGLVVVDHFEHGPEGAPVARRKLALVEALAARDDLCVAILSETDPGAEAMGEGAPAPDGPDGAAWAHALSRFEHLRLPAAGAAQGEWLLGPEIVALVWRKAAVRAGLATAADRWAIWGSLPRAEKLALAQLASEGYVNFRARRTLHRLLERGLIHRRPVVDFADEGFRHFVRQVSAAAPVAEWERAGGQSLVEALTLPVVVIACLVLVFLFSAQTDAILKISAALGTLLALLPVVGKVLGALGAQQLAKTLEDGVAKV